MTRGDPLPRAARIRSVLRSLAVVIALVSLWFGAWIVLPAPTYGLLTFSVGAPEVSPWLLVLSLAGIAAASAGVAESRVSRLALLACLLSLGVDALPLAAIGATIGRADTATASLRTEPSLPGRSRPFSLWDAFRGIPKPESIASRDVWFPVAGRSRLRMRVYGSARGGAAPIVVQIYGGAWQRGTPESNATFARWLAARGYVVCAIDYRHAPAWRWPVQRDDVDSALAYIGRHAGDFGGDAGRVVLLGRSAGAHLALMAALGSPPVRVRGVVDLYGPTDLVKSYRDPSRPDPIHVRAVESALIGGPLESHAAAYADASPIAHATHPSVPALLIYGARDHIVEAKYGRALAAALARGGARVAYIELPWADHAFDEVFRGPSSQLALYYMERFIASVVGAT